MATQLFNASRGRAIAVALLVGFVVLLAQYYVLFRLEWCAGHSKQDFSSLVLFPSEHSQRFKSVGFFFRPPVPPCSSVEHNITCNSSISSITSDDKILVVFLSCIKENWGSALMRGTVIARHVSALSLCNVATSIFS